MFFLKKLSNFKSILLNCTSKQNLDLKFFIHRHEIAGTGSPYKTTLKRKVNLTDPNKPLSLENEIPECLKWSDWKMFHDLKSRYIVSLNYPTRISLSSLYHYRLLPLGLREEVEKIIVNDFSRKTNWRLLKNRCTVTSRRRGKVARFRISRFVFRNLADNCKLSGVMKSTWGP